MKKSIKIRSKKSPLFLFLFALAFFGTVNRLEAQRFGAELLGGINVSQIDGDASAGYNKIGFTAGTNVLVYLKEKSYTSIGIVFAQRGAQNELNNSNNPVGANNFSLTLNYVEVPVLFHYRDWLVDEDEGLYRVDFHAGLSYGRLIGSRLKDDLGAISDITDRLQENDVAYVLGAGYHFNSKVSAVFQYKRSFTPIYKSDGASVVSPRGYNWVGHLLSGQLVYTF